MSQFRRLSISNRGLIIGDEPDLNKGEEHPWVVVGGVPYPTRRVGVNLRASALNYGKGRLSGYGAWRTVYEAHTAFRLRDHMHRVRRNGLNMILKGDMPSEQWLMQQALLGLGLGIPHLSVADDVYGRTLVLSGAVALGVGTQGYGHIAHITRDMIQYVPSEGVRVLLPGLLARRPSTLMGEVAAKAFSNYDYANFWKIVAKALGYDEVLMLSADGSEVAESTGSIPICIYYQPGNKILVRVPRLLSGRLNSIVTATLLELAPMLRQKLMDNEPLEWEIIDDEPLTLHHLMTANEIRLAGSWSGAPVVCEIGIDERYLTQVPNLGHLFTDGVGRDFYDWLLNPENFRPQSAKLYSWFYNQLAGPRGSELSTLFWRTVRDPEFCAKMVNHPEWHTRVEPLEGFLDE